jgi:hypothetical protein
MALEQAPLSGHVFAFRGRRGDLIKLLLRRRRPLPVLEEARTRAICVATLVSTLVVSTSIDVDTTTLHEIVKTASDPRLRCSA